jgi:hypothetical protein
METLSDEKGLRSLSYSQLVNLLKQFGISRHARDKKELMIGKLLRFSIHARIQQQSKKNLKVKEPP